MEYTHGGGWADFQETYGREPLDFSASLSPLGMPEGVREALRRCLPEASRYPDPRCRRLRQALSLHWGVPPEAILCGNGASELIWRAVGAARPSRALVTAPCFGEYEAALGRMNCEVERVPLDGTFHLPEEILGRIRPEIGLLFLCQPNNPSGVSIPPELLRRCALRCHETGTRLILDECFVDFLPQGEGWSLLGLLSQVPELLILRAFTKFYALAGVRLGFALSWDNAFLGEMERCGPPWSVSHLAQAAGLAALEEEDYARRLRALITRERSVLGKGLGELGLRVVPGEANFLLFQSPVPLERPLGERGILLRNCGDYAGLDGSWYRCALRLPRENRALLEALGEVLV